MTAKEKARELVFKMDVIPDKCVMFLDKDEIFESAKKAALIAVDEILNNNEKIKRSLLGGGVIFDNTEYWKEVKKEVELL